MDPLPEAPGGVWRYRHDGGTEHERFSTDVITDLFIEWLDRQREVDQPFCLITHFKAYHQPFLYRDCHADRFAKATFPEPPSLWENLDHRSPGSRGYGFTIDTMAHRLLQDSHGGWDPDPAR